MSTTPSQTTSKYSCESVLEVRHWDSPGLCSVRTTRAAGFTFVPGQFARLGLRAHPESLEPDVWRAYSMVSHPNDPVLEFLSTTVPNGAFSPKLAQLAPGDSIWIEKNPFGFLTLDRFSDANVLWLVSTGTGLSAYIPMLRDAQTWQRFAHVILVHGVRTQAELAYRDLVVQIMSEQNHTGAAKLVYLPITSREPWPGPVAPGTQPTRITTALQTGQLERAAEHRLDPEQARIMLCGNPEMVTEMRKMLSERGFAAGRRGNLGNLAVENYW